MSIFDNLKVDGPKPVPMKAFIVFTETGPKVVHPHGVDLEMSVDDIGDCAEDLGIWGAKDDPDHGLWVWEGHCRVLRDYYSGDVDIDYVTHEWRTPTEEELQLFVRGESPWSSQYIPCPTCHSLDVRYAGNGDRAMCLSCGNSFDPLEEDG